MKRYKIQYANGEIKIVNALDALDVVRKYDLMTRRNIKTKVEEILNVEGPRE